jgi:hypothetical protein
MQQVTLNKKHSINELKQILLNEYPKIIITKESESELIFRSNSWGFLKLA